MTGQGKKRDAARLNALALNPERPELETRDRLAALMGGPGNVDEAVEKCKWKQLQSRTYHVPNTAKLEGKADVFILLNHADVVPLVEGVSFVSGEEKLKAMIDPVKSTRLNQPFPDDTQVKILLPWNASV